MKSLSRLLVVIGLAMVMVVGFSPISHTQTKRTYKIAVVPWIGWSPAHVAEAKGFWKELGIDVKVVNFNTNQEENVALRGKRVDFAFDMIGSVVGYFQDGQPVVVVFQSDWSHGGDKILIKKGQDITKLKGKALGVYINRPSVTYFLNKYLASKGMKLSDFTIAEMDSNVLADNFIAGRLPVIVNYDPDALRAEREGNGLVAATSASYQGVIPEGLYTLKDNLKGIPAADIEKILAGWIKAVEWSQNQANWKEYQQILNAKTFAGSPMSEADLKGMLASVRIHKRPELLTANRAGGGLEAYLTSLKQFLVENKLLKKDFKASDILDTKAILKVLGG